MANSLQSATESLRSNRSVSLKVRSTGRAIMDSMDEGTAERGPNGLRIVRSAIVTGLTGVPHSKIPDALNARGLPRYGDAHPSPLADGLPLSHMSARIWDGEPDKAIVTLTYEFPSATGGMGWFENEPSNTSAPQIEVTTTLNQLTTNRDANGDTITVTYTQPLTHEQIKAEELEPTEFAQGGEVEKMVPTTTINYMRREPQSPGLKAPMYVGTTGSTAGTSRSRIFGDPDDYWLCTGIGGPSDDGGLTYNVTYSFQRAEPHRIKDSGGVIAEFPGWHAIVVYIDPETGKPPPDLLETGIDELGAPYSTGGLERKVIYRSTNFWLLNLQTA